MNRRGFLGAGLGSIVAATAAGQNAAGASQPLSQAQAGEATPPALVKLNVKPVMTNIIHTGQWEGPCRWHSVCVKTETEQAEKRFAGRLLGR